MSAVYIYVCVCRGGSRVHTAGAWDAAAGRNQVQHEEDKGNDAARLEVAQALPFVHDGAALVVVHECVCVRGAMARVSGGLLVGVVVVAATRVERAWQGDGDTAAGARETKVGPDAGSSLAGNFNAARHGISRKDEGARGGAGQGAGIQLRCAPRTV